MDRRFSKGGGNETTVGTRTHATVVVSGDSLPDDPDQRAGLKKVLGTSLDKMLRSLAGKTRSCSADLLIYPDNKVHSVFQELETNLASGVDFATVKKEYTKKRKVLEVCDGKAPRPSFAAVTQLMNEFVDMAPPNVEHWCVPVRLYGDGAEAGGSGPLPIHRASSFLKLSTRSGMPEQISPLQTAGELLSAVFKVGGSSTGISAAGGEADSAASRGLLCTIPETEMIQLLNGLKRSSSSSGEHVAPGDWLEVVRQVVPVALLVLRWKTPQPELPERPSNRVLAFVDGMGGHEEGDRWGSTSTRASSPASDGLRQPSPRHRPFHGHSSGWAGKRRLAPEAGWGHPAPQAAPQTPFRSPLQLRLPETLRSGDDGQLRVLFLMGLPGAGKSTVKRQRLRPDDLDIEPDQMKRRHHLFSEDMGEETDEEVHCWSVRRSVDAFEDAVRRRRRSILFDSSGSNASWLQRRIELAQRKGYVTELLWVDVPVEIALYRNRGRGFQNNRRGQFCPEHIILNKAKVLERSFQELSRYVCVAERMKNWCEGSYELEEAKEDLYLYPAPRTRPPALRPGMKHYGEAPDGARPPSPSAGSRRKLQIGPWKRNDEVTQKKNARLAWMDHTYHGDREYYVDKHVLGSRDILLERNKFPYQLPPGAEHWTIWSRKPMDHDELCDYVEGWLDAREPHHVVSWNYDDNRGRRTINIWHIHIYFQVRGGRPPRLTCPSEASEARGADEDRSSEPSAKRRRTVHTERRTDCIKTPSVHLSPSLKRSPCGV
ncbi:Zeta_toxin domain-containing protein [Durusdinium trenchii]|uniref:Zeta_toxin domain-containing protein n=1 Tax=Durusdinium trenchii TaxID=1381693 RepID=A0ABP0KAM4_9DINO